jgi:hypothetical protein
LYVPLAPPALYHGSATLPAPKPEHDPIAAAADDDADAAAENQRSATTTSTRGREAAASAIPGQVNRRRFCGRHTLSSHLLRNGNHFLLLKN